MNAARDAFSGMDLSFALRGPLLGNSEAMLEVLRLIERWPGNVRELKNCIERASAAKGAAVDVDGERLDVRVGSRLYDVERSLIEATLDYFKGNKRRAADVLGCSLKTLYNKLNSYSQNQECASS